MIKLICKFNYFVYLCGLFTIKNLNKAMNTFRTILTSMACLVLSSAFAQGPNNSGTYYQNADGKCGAELKTALHSIIKDPKVTSYKGLQEAYKKTDVRADGYLRDWYSNITKYVPGSAFGSYQKEGDAYNREHTVPQSWFNENSPMKSDIVHVVPTDGYINNMRSDWPFGEVNPNASNYKQSANGYSKYGSARSELGFSGTVFEPNDEIKGDIARIYFYMATCYENVILNWKGGKNSSDVISGTTYQPFRQWVMDMMLRWSKQDPVDEVETARNNAVYTVQKNRNPFVDYPGLEDYVWGSLADQPFSYDNYQGGGPIINVVAQPVFSPNGGTFTDFVEVTITTATEDAAIYYTTDGQDATEQSQLYEGPISITETTTLKAVAVKEETLSRQAEATFTIRKGGDTPVEEEGTITLNNAFFNTSETGSITKDKNSEDLVGTQGAVTVVYALGTGNYRYVNDSQIRLYGGNTLTFSTTSGRFAELTFELAENSTKQLVASNGTVDGLTWTGDAEEVTFNIDGSSGHMKMTKVNMKMSGSGPDEVKMPEAHTQPVQTIVYDLQGRKVVQPRRGLYIKHGRKFIVR